MQQRLIEQGAYLWIVVSGATVSAAVFAVWEVIQQHNFQNLDYSTPHYLYITGAISLAFFPVAWAACIIVAHRRASITRLRRSAMKYRQLIEEARDAIIVVDR
jgi:PAS domain-containing protein